MSIVSIYVLFATAEEAERVGDILLEERLAACINIIGPVQSTYRWEEKIERSLEVAAILKTTDRQSPALMDRIAELHSYDVPCIVSWPIDEILAPYARWVEESVTRTP